MLEEKTYICIDLKSFYASVECVERGLDPLNVNLVVADESRTEKTICLAVSPPLKSFGIPGRPRLFEVVQKVEQVNRSRKKPSSGKSYYYDDLCADPRLDVDYIVAVPRMGLYIDYSARIYEIYLKYISAEDIHVYSVDEVFIDATAYLRTYRKTAEELTMTILGDIIKETGITATAGIAPNLYLAKVAMDIVAKKKKPDRNGVRIARLTEQSYRETMWEHRPITDFWRVGAGYANRLAQYGMLSMGDVARCSLYNQALLYKLFGVNAELLINHAWGCEPCTIAHIKAYRPTSSSHSIGQVLPEPYEYNNARVIVKEMAEQLALDLSAKGASTNQIVLVIGYDGSCGECDGMGDITLDHYGRKIPKHAHGSENLLVRTASSSALIKAAVKLFEECVNPEFLIRRVNIVACNINAAQQLDLFSEEENAHERDVRIQMAILDIKDKYGKNAIFRGMNLLKGATAMSRNGQIGGHRA
ncbi:MAG: DNA methylase [Oscillospiraceae bacterium]